MNRCIRIVQSLLDYFNLIGLGALLLAATLAALPLLLAPRQLRQPVVQFGISAVCWLLLASLSACRLMYFDLRALDQLNQRRRMLLVPNHPSLIDAFLVLSRIPRAICLMKASISTNIFLGAGAHLAGYVSNRDPHGMFRAAIDAVERGNLLMVFPEGTRTTRQPVSPMLGSVGLIARKAGAPLQTILITTNSPYLSKGWKIWRPPQFPVYYRAELGRCIEAEATASATAASLQQYFEQALKLSIDPAMTL